MRLTSEGAMLRREWLARAVGRHFGIGRSATERELREAWDDLRRRGLGGIAGEFRREALLNLFRRAGYELDQDVSGLHHSGGLIHAPQR